MYSTGRLTYYIVMLFFFQSISFSGFSDKLVVFNGLQEPVLLKAPPLPFVVL